MSEGFESASFKAEFAQWDPPVKKAEKKTRKPDEVENYKHLTISLLLKITVI